MHRQRLSMRKIREALRLKADGLPVTLTELGVDAAVRALGAVLLTRQHQRHRLAPQLAVDVRPVRLSSCFGLDARAEYVAIGTWRAMKSVSRLRKRDEIASSSPWEAQQHAREVCHAPSGNVALTTSEGYLGNVGPIRPYDRGVS